MTKRDKAILYTLAVALIGVGIFQIIQAFQYGRVTACQASIVNQFVVASGPRSDAQEAKDLASAAKDRAEANLGDVLLDPKATDAEKKDAFVAWHVAGDALADASEHNVKVKAENPLPPPPTSVCGAAQ